MLDKLQDEPGRLSALVRYAVLDTAPEAQFDKITSLVRTVLGVPIAAVSLIDQHRQWFKSRQGIGFCATDRSVSFCNHTIQAHRPLIVNDARVHPLFANNPLVAGEPLIRSYLGVPLTSPDGYNLGALCAIDTKPRQFDSSQIELMTNFGAIVMDELELRLIAHTDSLTGAKVRRVFMAELDRARTRFARQNEPSAVLMLDIDRFKSINDTLGHAAGDAVLAAVAICCGSQVREGDSFGRLGGEEFAIMLENVSHAEAAFTAERFRQSIADLRIASLRDLHVTASIGVASLTSDIGSTQEWLALADSAMYAAKRGGRNRCCIAEQYKMQSFPACFG